MFEKVIPIPRDNAGTMSADNRYGELLIGNVDSAPAAGGNALRALEWNEITARLNAARDLRLLMKRDSRLNIQTGAASFGDAAATYFQALDTEEHSVNHDALEQCKASTCIGKLHNGVAATGDARDSE